MTLVIEIAKAGGARDRRDIPATSLGPYPEMETNGQFFKRYRALHQKRLDESKPAVIKKRRKKEGE